MGGKTDERDELAAWLALSSLATTGTARWLGLVRSLGCARAVFAATDAELDAHRSLTARGRAALRAFDAWDRLERLRDDCETRGIGIVSFGDTGYPGALRTIPDPPVCLYWRGALPPAAVTPAVAVVGARRATRYGVRTARRIGAALAGAGAWVVSGLAIGIDAAAQEAAVDAGKTAAVLAGGVDRCFPGSNRRLARKIVETGIVLSELPPGTPTLPHQFPIRNRIITGLAMATVIVEAHARGGSLVSARWAADQSRTVLAVPGPIDSPASVGTNRLLFEGAVPLLDPAEMLRDLGLARALSAGETHPTKIITEPETAAIYAELSDDPLAADELVAKCRLDERAIMEKLTALELDGLAERLPGGTYVRSSRASETTEQS